MQKYKHLFFDLDHTLWDYDTNSAETLSELFETYRLGQRTDATAEDLVQIFNRVNADLWQRHDQGQISKGYIREQRFNLIFEELGIYNQSEALQFSSAYIMACPQKSHLLPFAREILKYLASYYSLHLITNGFEEIQHIKIRNSGLKPYFEALIISESVGHRKPEKAIFEHALQVTGASRRESVMIGDNLRTDIRGARESRIDQVFYNPGQHPHQEQVTYEIDCLSKLRELF